MLKVGARVEPVDQLFTSIRVYVFRSLDFSLLFELNVHSMGHIPILYVVTKT